MSIAQTIFRKLTTRNTLSLGTAGVFLYVVFYVVTVDSSPTENPVVMLLLGQFSTVIGMIYIFYYRKTQSKENTS